MKELKETGINAKQFTDTLRYGLPAPLRDYYHFNCSRKDSVRNMGSYPVFNSLGHVFQDWRYDRTQLVYMREIGEGQFGKVLLMTAKVITAISCLKM